jgi:hypothetical protein
MPWENDPDYLHWKTPIGNELAASQGQVLLVGHSLGASFLLKYLSEEKIRVRPAGLFLIATPFWGGDGWRYEGYEAVVLPEDLASKLPKGAPIFFYHSRDDEVVPFAHLALYAKRLPHAVTRAFHGRGHQLGNDLSELAADIKSLESFEIH